MSGIVTGMNSMRIQEHDFDVIYTEKVTFIQKVRNS